MKSPPVLALAAFLAAGFPFPARAQEPEAAPSLFAAAEPTGPVTLVELDATFARLHTIDGAGAHRARLTILSDLARRCTSEEWSFVTALMVGEIRQGALRAIV